MKKKIILVLYFLFFAYVIINMTEYIVSLHTNNLYEGKPVMKDSVRFIFEEESMTDISFLQNENELTDITVLYQDINYPYEYHVVFSKGKYDIFYGDYLQNWDFSGTNTGMIVGKDATTDYTYDVLGEFEDNGIASKAKAVFLVDECLSEFYPGNLVYLASGKEGHAKKAFSKLKQILMQRGISVCEVNSSYITFGSYDDNEEYIYIIYAVFLAVMFAVMMIAAYLWMIVNRTYYRVLVMCGDNNPYIKITLPFVIIGMFSWICQYLLFIYGTSLDPFHKLLCGITAFIFYGVMYIPLCCKSFFHKAL